VPIAWSHIALVALLAMVVFWLTTTTQPVTAAITTSSSAIELVPTGLTPQVYPLRMPR
jgi:hypothetical protein